MKVIDLLNKIANGEEVPKKIKINGYIYEYQGDDYLYIDKNNDNHEYWLFSDSYTNKFQWLDVFLKTEVEIIEEKKIPEKLETYKENDDEDCYANILKVSENGEYEIDEATSVIVDKINEIIDYLREKEDE